MAKKLKKHNNSFHTDVKTLVTIAVKKLKKHNNSVHMDIKTLATIHIDIKTFVIFVVKVL